MVYLLEGLRKNIFMFRIFFLLLIIMSQPACEMLGIQDRYPLLTAAQNGDMIAATELLSENAAVNSVSEDQRFALLEASSNGNLEMVKLFVDNGADVNLLNKSGMTALMAAASDGNEDVVSFLIDNGADIALTNYKGFSALFFAINKDNKKSVQLLINHKAPINDSSADGTSPLFLAVKKGYNDVASILIENGADLNAVDANGNTALHMAAVKANHEMLMVLIENGADIHIKNDSKEDGFLVFASAKYGSIMNNIYERVEKKMNEFSDENSDTGNLLITYNLNDLLKALESVNPEHLTSRQMDEIIDLLDNSTLSIDISEDKFNSVAEQLKEDYLSTAKTFLDNGVDVNETDRQSQSVIMMICRQNTRISTIFKDKSIPLRPDTEKKINIAFKVAESIYGELIQLYIDAGVDVNLVDQYGQTVLTSVCGNGNFEYAKLLIESGAEVNRSNNDGWTSLIYAVSAENVPISELLISSGANVNEANAFGETALLKAVYRNNIPLVSLLLKSGANINIENSHGDSPLSVAQKKGYLEILEMFKSYS